jgi:hypothetical protein
VENHVLAEDIATGIMQVMMKMLGKMWRTMGAHLI